MSVEYKLRLYIRFIVTFICEPGIYKLSLLRLLRLPVVRFISGRRAPEGSPILH